MSRRIDINKSVRWLSDLFSENPSRWTVTGCLFFCIIVLTYFVSPMFQNFNYMQPDMDWYGFGTIYECFRTSILKFGQFPLRTLYLEGGYPTIGFAYDIALSPFSVFILIFGTTPGMKVMMFVAFLLGASGMFYLIRFALRYNLAAATFGTLAFSLCGWVPMQVDNANVPLLMAPFIGIWTLAFYIRALQSPRYLVGGAVAMYLILVMTVQSAVPVAVLLGITCLIYTFSGLDKEVKFSFSLRPLAILLLMAMLSALFAAPKLLSIIDFEKRLTTFVHMEDEGKYLKVENTIKTHSGAYPWRYLKTTMTKKTFLGLKKDVDVYYLYQGTLTLIFAALAIFLVWKKSLRWAIILLFFICFNLGPFCPVNIYKILWYLFWPMKYIWKINKYFSFYIPISMAILSAGFFEGFTEVKRWKTLVASGFILVMGMMIFNNVSNSRWLFEGLYTKPTPSKQQLSAEPYGQIWVTGIPDHRYNDLDSIEEKERYFSQYPYIYIQKGIGTINWPTNLILTKGGVIPKYLAPSMPTVDYDVLPLSKLELNPDYKGEVYFQSGSDNQASLLKMSPNKIIVSAEISDSAPLLINQNYHNHFRTSVGKLADIGGILGVQLPPGNYKVVLKFVPWPFYLGLLLSVISVMATILVLFRDRFSRFFAPMLQKPKQLGKE